MTFTQPVVSLSAWVSPRDPYVYGTGSILWYTPTVDLARENYPGILEVPNPNQGVWAPVQQNQGNPSYNNIPNRWVHGNITYGLINGVVVYPQ